MSQPHQIPGIICAENVAITHLLHEVPRPPGRNEVDESLIAKKGYILPFQKECDLVETLAFLSKTIEGPEYIPAVCALQNPTGTCLTIVLAINKAAHSSGDNVLRTLREDFEKLFRLLEHAHYGRNNETEHTLFERIIEMCSIRIRCRLRLAEKPRDIKRKSLVEALEVVPQYIAQIKSGNLDPDVMDLCSSFSQHEHKLSKLVKAWSNYPKDHRLSEVVQQIWQMKQAQNIGRLLDLMSNKDMDPSLKKGLVNMIEKVSRYREAARALYRMAKKYPLVRHMRFETVNLPAEAFTRVSEPRYLPDLGMTLSRVGIPERKQAALYPILHPKLKPKQLNLENQFQSTVRDSLKNAKVHAEVQIIAWCAIQAPTLHPRVISSSKDACYLCDRLIQLYGKMHTPRTHGRLYPGWRLPNIIQFKHLEKEFNATLAHQIQESSNAMLKSQKRIMNHQPNESSLLPLLHSDTTMSIKQVDRGSSTSSRYETVALTPQSISLSNVSDIVAIIKECPTALPSSCALSVNSTTTAISLKQGQPMSSHSRNGKISPLFVARSLEISIEFETVSTSQAIATPIAWNVEWIKPEEMKSARNKDLVVDAQLLSNDEVHSLPESRCLWICSSNVMLKITCYTPTIDSQN